MKKLTRRYVACAAGLALSFSLAGVASSANAAVVSSDSASPTATASASYPASGYITSAVFYTHLQVDAKDGSGKKFVGDGGGLFTPGAGALIGDIYTDDLARLYSSTVSFEVNATPVYTNINFFDANSNLLGSLHTGSVSTVAGVGGGTGSWG